MDVCRPTSMWDSEQKEIVIPAFYLFYVLKNHFTVVCRNTAKIVQKHSVNPIVHFPDSTLHSYGTYVPVIEAVVIDDSFIKKFKKKFFTF